MSTQRRFRVQFPVSLSKFPVRNWVRRLLPTPGNVLFTLFVIGALFWASSVGAFPLRTPSAPAAASINTIAYQGRLADSSGNPLTGTYNMEFRLYTQASGGTSLWNEMWTGANSVQVSDGLFNIMLGSLNSIPPEVITGNNLLWLGITVNTDSEMQPRVQLGTVPYAVRAERTTNADLATHAYALSASDGDPLDAVIINLDGDVGIGQPSPSAKLDVNGNLIVRGPGEVGANLIVGGTDLYLRGAGGGAGNNGGVGRALVDGGSGAGLVVNYSNDFGKVAIQGKVGIGTTNPQATLDVNGNLGFTGQKVCQVIRSGMWIDTTIVPATWGKATCASYRDSEAADRYKLGCMYADGFSWGGDSNGVPPSPNCGW